MTAPSVLHPVRGLPRARRALLAAAVGLLAALGVAAGTSSAAPGQAGALVGTFSVDPGACSGGSVTGSHLRLVLPSGTVESGPWVENGDSTCSDVTYTPFGPGADGGLVTGRHQPAPDPRFDADGNSLAVGIIRPVRFFGVDFSASTNAVDLQTGDDTPAPTLTVADGRITGDLSAFDATWNQQAFNQGAPKPDGSQPGNTTPVSGTYDAATGRYEITWASQIEGGPFNDFTGVWHLEGTFTPPGAGGATSTRTETTEVVVDDAAAQAGGTPGVISSVPGASAVDGATATTVAGSTGADPAATPGVDDQAVASYVESASGWRAPAWLVVVTALAAIAAAIVLVGPYRVAPAGAAGAPPRGRWGRGGPGGPSSTGAGDVDTAAIDEGAAAAAAGPARSRRRTVVGMIAIGVGLALAPVAFQMFTRAPAGGDMIEDFAPHMTAERLSGFGDDLTAIRAARDEAAAVGIDPVRFPQAARFVEEFPAIDADMSSMLTDMEGTVDEYDGVAALPPFVLFPWFFVIPGLILAGLGVWVLRSGRGAPLARPQRIALVALAVGLLAAPAVFGMFTRAPGGQRMIAEFRPLMTEEKVTTMQGYFLVIGGGEAQLRNEVGPELIASGRADQAVAMEALSERWPALSGGMAPMIGAMSDNLEAFAGISALPPFGLFPWFFVIPGLLVIGLVVANDRIGREPAASTASTAEIGVRPS